MLKHQAELEAADASVAAREKLSEVDEEIDPTMRLDLTLGYVEMIEMRDRAMRDREKLEALLATLKNSASLVQEAASLLEGDQPEKALQVAEKILRDIPNHQEAKALSERAREKLSRRARQQEKERQLAELLKQAQALYRRADFEGSLSVLERALVLDRQHAETTSLREKVVERLEQKRLEEEKARQAEEVFKKATSKFSEGDPAACLPLIAEVMKLQPGHLAATALQEQAQRRLHEIAKLEEKRQAVRDAITAARQALDAGKLAQARKELKPATELDPNASAVTEVEQLIEQAEAERRAKEEKKRKVQMLLSQARSLDQSGKDEEALERLAELSALQPNFQPATELKHKIDERRDAREQAERERQEKIAENLRKAQRHQSSRFY